MTEAGQKIIKVLIVDDSMAIRRRIKELFAELKNILIIAEADNSREAIKLGTEYKPDVMILDINLSGGENGLKVAEQVKRIHPAVITIILSNNSAMFYKRKLTEFGADYFFDKSNEFDEMLKVFSWI